MLEFMRGWVINIVTLVIFITLLEILIPSGKVKKFINLVSGFVIMVTLLSPFLKILNKDIDINDLEFQQTMSLNQKDMERRSKELDQMQAKQVTEVYRQKIINDIETFLENEKEILRADADVILDEDIKSESYGRVEKVFLSLELKEEKSEIEKIKRVEKVQITSNRKVKETKANITKGINLKLKSKLEDKISQSLGVEKENIVITKKE